MSNYTDKHYCPECKRSTWHCFHDTGHSNPDYTLKCLKCGYERDDTPVVEVEVKQVGEKSMSKEELAQHLKPGCV